MPVSKADQNFVSGDAVLLIRSIQGAVKGARATVVSVHPRPRFNPEAYITSEFSPCLGEQVVTLRLQTNSLVENIPLSAIKKVL